MNNLHKRSITSINSNVSNNKDIIKSPISTSRNKTPIFKINTVNIAKKTENLGKSFNKTVLKSQAGKQNTNKLAKSENKIIKQNKLSQKMEITTRSVSPLLTKNQTIEIEKNIKKELITVNV